MSHHETIRVMVHQSRGQFDPVLVACLAECAAEFERIYLSEPDA